MLSATPLDLCGVTSSDLDSSSLKFAHFSLHEVIFSTEDLKKFLLFGIFFSALYLHRGMHAGISSCQIQPQNVFRSVSSGLPLLRHNN